MTDLINLIRGKCPNCEKGNIFSSRGNVFLFRMPRMHRKCENCGYNFVQEPGYFFGAMYVSYVLTIAEMIAIMVIVKFMLGLGNLYVFFIVAVVAVALSTFNFRMSRTIWMYIFRKKKAPEQT
ncbi:DUF983 domain-containing protein [Sinomicrobium weinanense]|uniref:DUF983 domain-containing protein n=1 Tax=Sinomicrobium weinanense TaxID=2842200 RepID=A0A926Q159_9FLAO|nr:DUF983 domain-containing protein [Sinomicrobium weinanense]MBC9795502.1 DUF983 domain-containing protein [Sinomicrobium weinanense]MBU3123351.1 DUF983 domain-containing protein [Sinomicrobium weinanense]